MVLNTLKDQLHTCSVNRVVFMRMVFLDNTIFKTSISFLVKHLTSKKLLPSISFFFRFNYVTLVIDLDFFKCEKVYSRAALRGCECKFRLIDKEIPKK